MKNRLSLLLLPFLLLSSGLGGCSTSKSKVYLPYGDLYDATLDSGTHFITLTYADLAGMVQGDSDSPVLPFALIIQGDEDSCVCWSTFRKNVEKYQYNYQTRFYTIKSEEFVGHDYLDLNVRTGHETIALFDGSKFAYQQTTSSSEDKFATDYSTLESWLKENLVSSKMLYITQKQLDSLFKQNVAFVVGYVRSGCGDCSYVLKHALVDINKKSHYTSYLYECETEGVYLKDGVKDEEQWQAFKDKMGISGAKSSWGYSTGFVPTWIYYQSNGTMEPSDAASDADVWANDTVEANGDGTYKVSSSYFDGSRDHAFLSESPTLTKDLTTLTSLSKDDVNVYEDGSVSWKHSSAAKYHDPLLTTFINYYLGNPS